ncbi:MAG: sodium-dependent transporter, partial [Alphaproteobacteria bacterium]
FAIGLPSLLSFNVLKDFHPLKSVPIFADKTVFDLLDFTIANILFPLNALLISLFVGWGISGATVGEELALQGLAARLWRFSVRFLSPLLILGLMIKLVVDQGS